MVSMVVPVVVAVMVAMMITVVTSRCSPVEGESVGERLAVPGLAQDTLAAASQQN